MCSHCYQSVLHLTVIFINMLCQILSISRCFFTSISHHIISLQLISESNVYHDVPIISILHQLIPLGLKCKFYLNHDVPAMFIQHSNICAISQLFCVIFSPLICLFHVITVNIISHTVIILSGSSASENVALIEEHIQTEMVKQAKTPKKLFHG